MRKFAAVGLLASLAALLATSTLTQVTLAQVKKGKTRLVSTKQLMSGLVQTNCAALGKGTKEAPADQKGWDALATQAALLNEASYSLMDDGRCPDAEWANAAKRLRAGSAALLAKVEAKDLEGAAAEFKTMTQSCAACHKAHRPQAAK